MQHKHAHYTDEDYWDYGENQTKVLFPSLIEPGCKLLDYGAGWGRLSIPLAGRGCDVIAVEQDSQCLDYLRQKRPPIKTVIDSQRDNAGGPFDVVLSFHVLQHRPLESAKEFFAEMVKSLKPGGRLIFTYPTFPKPRLAPDEYKHADEDDGLPEFHCCDWSRWLNPTEIPRLFELADIDRGSFESVKGIKNCFTILRKSNG